MSQSINNFSDYDISQSHDWKCPSLSPHVLLNSETTRAEVVGWGLGPNVYTSARSQSAMVSAGEERGMHDNFDIHLAYAF